LLGVESGSGRSLAVTSAVSAYSFVVITAQVLTEIAKVAVAPEASVGMLQMRVPEVYVPVPAVCDL